MITSATAWPIVSVSIDCDRHPEVVAGGSDPQTFFTRRGTALFITLGNGKRPDGRSLSLLLVYRSENGVWLTDSIPPQYIRVEPSK